MRVLSSYTEEFRRNVAAVLRGGLKLSDIANRLNILTNLFAQKFAKKFIKKYQLYIP